MTHGAWEKPFPSYMLSPPLTVGSVRIVRPTSRLDECVRFYHSALGFELLAEAFADRRCVSVLMTLGGTRTQLEFAGDPDVSGYPPPPALYLYLTNEVAVLEVSSRLLDAGHQPQPVADEGLRRGVAAFSDPDGWQVVLVPLEPPTGAP